MADLCKRCRRAECLADRLKVTTGPILLECREEQLELTQRALASAQAQIAHCRVLLARVRDALDVAIEETTPDEPEGDGG